jgi:hypothetical protein
VDRRVARAAVELIRQDPRFEADLAASRFDSPMEAAEALAYLCGFLVEMQAKATGSTEDHVIELLSRYLDDGPGSSGVREPRRPMPSSDPVSGEADHP